MNRALILAVVVLSAACVSQPAQMQQMRIQDVDFKTEDGFTIYATLYGNSSSGIVLLHMLNSGRSAWKGLAERLAENYTVLAVDLRGHGQSIGVDGTRKVWQSFTEDDFNRMTLDVKAAKEFLLTQNVKDVTLIGASIGANIALKYAAYDRDIRAVVLLSPGYEYRGVNITETVKSYDRPVLLAASSEDIYSADTAKYLYFFAAGMKRMHIFSGAGHGTDMLGRTSLAELIQTWLGEI